MSLPQFKVRAFGHKVVNYVEFNIMAVITPKATPKLNTEILLWTLAKCDRRQSFVSIKGSVTDTSKTNKQKNLQSKEAREKAYFRATGVESSKRQGKQSPSQAKPSYELYSLCHVSCTLPVHTHTCAHSRR